MAGNQRLVSDTLRHSAGQGSTMVLRVPKPNLQVIILGLIAIITLFQTFQLIRINSNAGSAAVKVAPAAVINSGTENNTDVPESMVGGC